MLTDIYYSLKRLWVLLKPVEIQYMLREPDSKEPTRAYKTDGAYDCYAIEDIVIPTGGHINIRTGLSVQVPSGWSYDLRGRSGLNKKGILCSLGLVDSWYNGEIKAVISNFSNEDYTFKKGDRICQMKINPVFDFRWKKVEKFDNKENTRGESGWGSSGR